MVQPVKLLISIGYEGRDLKALIEELTVNNVRALVDVRLTPLSRKPGMSKRRLAEAVENAGIKYVHLKDLGNPRDNRQEFRAGLAHSRERYSKLLGTAPALHALGEVTYLIDKGVVALMCFERDHAQCHRELVAEALRANSPDVKLLSIQ